MLGPTFKVAAAAAPTAPRNAANSARGTAPGDLAPFVGRYYSDELDATYEVVANGPALTVRRPRGEVDTLMFAGEQTFRANGLTYRFMPNAGGKAAGFAVDIGRARGMGFKRVD